MNDGALEETLALIRDAASVFEDDWLIIGSAAAAISGAEIGEIQDIDLLTSVGDADRLAVLWRAMPQQGPSPSRKFRSARFIRFETGALPVEVMAGFEMRVGGAWVFIRPETRLAQDGVFIPAVAEQVALLRRMNRPKDQPRIAALLRIANR